MSTYLEMVVDHRVALSWCSPGELFAHRYQPLEDCLLWSTLGLSLLEVPPGGGAPAWMSTHLYLEAPSDLRWGFQLHSSPPSKLQNGRAE